MSEHTPGPWKAELRLIGSQNFNDGRGWLPCWAPFVDPLRIQVYGRGWDHKKHGCGDDNFLPADALLIAAAPEGYELAEMIEGLNPERGIQSTGLHILRGAAMRFLAKARTGT